MKKWVLGVVSILCAGLLVACGGNKSEETIAASTVSEENVKMSSESSVDSEGSDSSEAVKDESVASEEPSASEEKEEEMSAEVVKEDGHEKASEAVDKMLVGWNLGNSFDATGEWILQYTDGTNSDFETAWGNPVTSNTLMPKVKELGFEAVRIPITWRYHFDEEGNIDEAWMARVQEVVDQALAAELYCIINVHHDTGANGWLRATEANFYENSVLFAKLWQQIAERFKDYPDTRLCEGFNEMLDDNAEWNNPKPESVTAINNYNQLFVDTVRETGGNNAFRNLVCCTYAAAHTDSAINGFMMPEDTAVEHLIAEFHFYVPYEFITEEGVTWTTPISEYTDYVESSIDAVFARVKNKMMTKGVPVIIGEFAADDKENTEDRIKWYTHVIEKANEQNITCFIWDNGNGFCMGHIDREGDADDFPEIIEACVKAAK